MHIHTIKQFVESATDEVLRELYKDYHRGCFDHLLPHPRKDVPTSRRTKRKALLMFLDATINQTEEEMGEEIAECVRERSFEKLIDLLQNDEFFQGILMLTLNRGNVL